MISKLTFYDFDALDVVEGVNLVVSFKQSDIPRFCDVVEGYCTLSAYSKYENKLSAFIACIIDSIPDDQCYIVRYDDCWTANDSVMPDLHIALEHNNISNINKAIVGKKCSKLVSSLAELSEIQSKVTTWGYDLKPEWLPFVTCLGDCDILLFDLNRYEQNNTNYILYGDQEERVENWAYIKGGFQKWIDRLIVSQGSKYWSWF